MLFAVDRQILDEWCESIAKQNSFAIELLSSEQGGKQIMTAIIILQVTVMNFVRAIFVVTQCGPRSQGCKVS